ncbi:MAG: DNA replication/repair protein RecF [Gammaproteobacteria bacterium]|nr:MAG: DNA replication/repair protein RecF [Gammaproteobacteria bacterium]
MSTLKLRLLRWQGLRNLEDGELSARDVNIVYGANGAGKTSLLEGLYILNRGRSFRTPQLAHCVQHQRTDMTLFARFQSDQGADESVGACVYSNGQPTEWRLNGERPKGLSQLANVAPVILITPETLSLVSGTPQLRRQFLDGGMFHVEPFAWEIWRQWRHALRNRNQILKSGRIDSRLLSAWDSVYVAQSTALSQARQFFVERLNEHIGRVQTLMKLGLGRISLHFQRGWSRELTLEHVLEEQSNRDWESGYTHSGPHKADFEIRVDGERWTARRYMSRGQQKMIAIVLELARLSVLREKKGDSGIVLVDDVTAELDQTNQRLLFDGLLNSGAQLFITTLDDQKHLLPGAIVGQKDRLMAKMFHVEHGKITASVLE